MFRYFEIIQFGNADWVRFRLCDVSGHYTSTMCTAHYTNDIDWADSVALDL